MILVGGAGATMLDAWVTPDRWRVAVPPLGLVRRGGADAPDDLPVAFLRWWFFRPLAGALFAASPTPVETWLLRDGDALVEVRAQPCTQGAGTSVKRRVRGVVETIEACGSARPPSAGDHVRYENEATGLVVELRVEGLAPGSPPSDAFDDPEGRPR
jgi:hypothetical protein